MEAASKPPPLQRFVFLVALWLWAVVPIASWLVAVGCYVAALVIVNGVAVFFPGWIPWAAESRGRQWLLIAALGLLPALSFVRLLADSDLAASWGTLRENVADRLALEQRPAISPALVVTYEPQRFFIFAPGAARVAARWTPESKDIPAVDLSHGVFLLDFDPRNDPALQQVSADSLDVALNVDGAVARRTMRLVRPQPHPRQIRSAPEKGLAATVSEETDELILIRRDGSHEAISVGDGPTDCVISASGVLVAHRYVPELWLVDIAADHAVKKIPAPAFQTTVSLSPNGKLAAVAVDAIPPGVLFLSAPDFDSPEFVELPFSPDRIEFGDDETLVITDRRGRAVRFLENKSEWRLAESTLYFPRAITAVGRAPEGKIALASTASQAGGEPVFANHFIENTIHLLDVSRRNIVATHITDRRGLNQDSPGDTEHGISPLALATVDGRLLAACAGSNEIAEFTAPGAAPRYFSLDSSPLFAPQGVGDLGEGVWCVSSPVDGSIGVFERDSGQKRLIRLAPDDESLDRNDPAALARRRGERTFFEGTRAGIACQSCHLGGGTDFSSHDIGQGKPVDTLSVRGLIGTSPYLRDASHWRLRDLHEVARVGYRDHQRSVPWDRAAAVAAYLESLPPQSHARAREEFSLERMRAGVAAFFAADCAVCHTPPAMTNLGQHSAKGLFPDYDAAASDRYLDTPTLRGVSLTPPYLHDGRAATLRAVLIDWNRAGRHGNTARLSAEQLDDLLYFLERL